MIPIHRIELVLTEDGKLSLNQLPFQAGQMVEVVIRLIPSVNPMSPLSIRGAVLRYDRPTDPVADSDWGVLQ